MISRKNVNFSGWLKEAQVAHSNFALFLEPGKEVPDVGDEDGEISDAQDKLKYDFTKIHEWPGFNANAPQSCRDESQRYRYLKTYITVFI